MNGREETQLTAMTDSELSEDRPLEPVLHLTILSHPDTERVGEVAMPVFLGQAGCGEPAELSRLKPLFEPLAAGVARALDDPCLSRAPILLNRTADGGLSLNPAASPTRGRLNGKDLTATLELSGRQLANGAVLELGSRIVLWLHLMSPRLVAPPAFGLVGESESMWRLRREISQIADLSVPVLLRGESGTGKELVARAIHRSGPRRTGPYHAINMAAIPVSLAASELFGAAKGAFSGADKRRPGYFERANSGTLFLDEVAEMSMEVQALMLRVLESGEIQPVGSEAPQKVDVRVISATDANLESAISEGRFRAPMLHRLAGFEMELPPLRQRRDDIGRLFFHFLAQELEAVGELDQLRPRGRKRPFVSADLMARLVRHSWPGNVRQLRNVVRQLVVTSRGSSQLVPGSRVEKLLREGDPAALGSPRSVPDNAPGVEGPAAGSGQSRLQDPDVKDESAAGLTASPERSEVDNDGSGGGRRAYRDPSEVTEVELVSTLEAHQFRIQPTAKALGISRTSLYVLIDGCSRIRKASDLSADQILQVTADEEGRLPASAQRLGVSLQGLKMRIRELDLSF